MSVQESYVGHLRGSAYPSKPGLTLMLFMKLRQLRHWMEMRVALQRIDEAAITMPGIFTSWDTCSDYTNSNSSTCFHSLSAIRIQFYTTHSKISISYYGNRLVKNKRKSITKVGKLIKSTYRTRLTICRSSLCLEHIWWEIESSYFEWAKVGRMGSRRYHHLYVLNFLFTLRPRSCYLVGDFTSSFLKLTEIQTSLLQLV